MCTALNETPFTYPGGIEGWVDLRGCITELSIRYCWKSRLFNSNQV